MYWPMMLMGAPPQDGSKIAWRPQNAFAVSPPQRPMYGAAMIERKAALLRLYPTPQQASQMAQIAGACRFVYNLALEQRRDWYRAGRTFTFAGQCRELTQLRAAEDWLKAVPVHPLQQALRDLARAYRNWWEGRTCPTARLLWRHCRCAICRHRRKARRKHRAEMCEPKPVSTAPSSIKAGAACGLCSPTSWQTGAHDYSKWPPPIPARPVRRAALSMPAAVAINRTLFASRVVMKPMPTQMRRSTYYGARTARCSLWRNTAASGPTKQEPSGGLLDAEHWNPRYSWRGGCQIFSVVGSRERDGSRSGISRANATGGRRIDGANALPYKPQQSSDARPVNG